MKNRIFKNMLWGILLAPLLVNLLSGQQIYFADNQAAKVQKSDIDGNNLGDLTTSTIGLYGIATDITNNKIYYTNVATDQIFTANLDGTSPTVLLDNSDGIDGPRGIAIDGVNNKIYWAESITGKIKKADLDGNNIVEVITGLSSPVDVGLDLVNNKVYWSDNGIGQKKISRSDLTTIASEDVIIGLDQVGGIEVDAEFSKLYWVDFGATDKVSRANLDGSSPQDLVTIPSGSPRGIAVDKDNNKLFWSDVLGQSIGRSNRDGTSSSTILSTLSHPIGISTDWESALPVELTTFSINIVENTAILNWETATEVNNYGFEVERQYQELSIKNQESNLENPSWEKVAFIAGSGNSNSNKVYSYSDNSISASGKYLYRLKQIDIDGKFEYSNTIEVEVGIPTEFDVQQNFPNPFNPSTTISFSIPEMNNVSVKIYNMLGQEVFTLVNEQLGAGRYNYNFDASNLSSGNYIYRVTAGKNVETRKMILVK